MVPAYRVCLENSRCFVVVVCLFVCLFVVVVVVVVVVVYVSNVSTQLLTHLPSLYSTA